MSLPSEIALWRGSSGHWMMVEGPFESASEPDPKLPSVYCNRFDLSDPKPWKIGQGVLGAQELASCLAKELAVAPPLEWQQLDEQKFAQVFEQIQARIATGELEKAVPALVHRAKFASALSLTEHCLPRLLQAKPGLYGYGLMQAKQGFCGLSPEILLRVQGRVLRSVALAGTAPAAQSQQLLEDSKEIREHELVAGYLYDKLETLGKVRRHPRKLRKLGSLVHLESLFELELDHHWQAHELIAKLHPTPALGTQPRTSAALLELQEWRNQLEIPAEFGAPFGLAWQGELEILVAIRGLWWQGDELKLPTGCGIIEQSLLERELAELVLKRDWVASQFGL